MKRETSIRNALEVANRIKKVSGIYCTPDCDREAVRIKRAWLFGSTVKGKENPHDTDILLEYEIVGRFNTTSKLFRQGWASWKRGNAKNGRRSMGIMYAKEADVTCFRYLSKGMKMIRLHQYRYDHEIAHPRVMIYPKNELLD